MTSDRVEPISGGEDRGGEYLIEPGVAFAEGVTTGHGFRWSYIEGGQSYSGRGVQVVDYWARVVSTEVDAHGQIFTTDRPLKGDEGKKRGEFIDSAARVAIDAAIAELRRLID